MKINCLIVDDEPLAREGLRQYIDELPYLKVVAECQNAAIAESVLKSRKVDLIFLDINMPKLSGIDFLRTLKDPPLVIFTTAYREFAVESYDLGGLDYLVKPVTIDRFTQAATKAKDYLERVGHHTGDKLSDDYFFVKTDGAFKKIHFQNIAYIESLKDYIFIYDEQGNRDLVLVSLKKAAEYLPNDKFLRIHRSYIIALDKVIAIEGNQLVVQQARLPVSKGFREAVQQRVLGGRVWER